MTVTLNDVARKKDAEQSAEQAAAIERVRMAREQGLSLTGPDGLLKQLTKTVLETALNEEMTEHLGYEKHDPAGAGSGNISTCPDASVSTVFPLVPLRRSTFPGTGPARSNHRSSANGNDDSTGSTRWCCRSMPKA